jgi:nucleoid DNA-binding protein
MYRRVLPSFRARFFSTAEKQSTKTKAVKAPKVSAEAESESSTDSITRRSLVDTILEETQLQIPKSHVDLILSTFLKQIRSNVLTHHKKVRLANFGIFHIRDLAARRFLNPRTGAEIKVGARQKMGFRASKAKN